MNKAILIILAAIAVLLSILVYRGSLTPDCELLYNNYTSTTNVQMQQALMDEGVRNGCFHVN